MLLSAAAVVGFAVGVGFDRLLAEEPRSGIGGAHAEPLPTAEPRSPDVFAAGLTSRDYHLPGGGRITLAPGTIVDTVAVDGRGLTLRLVRGEASLSTAAAGHTPRATPLALLVGEARVMTAAGDLRVKRSGESAELEVLHGSARVASPDAQLGVRQTTLGANQTLTVPLRITMNAIARRGAGAPAAALPSVDEEPAVEAPIAAPVAGWRDRCRDADFSAALRLLREETGGGQAAVAAAGNAWDLMCIRDAFSSRGGDLAVAEQALARVVNEFPSSSYAPMASYMLANMHSRSGNPAVALAYYERSRALSPGGALADDALCKMIVLGAQAGNAEAVLRQGQHYQTQYPDGSCIDEIKRLMVESAAAQAKAAEQEPHQPPESGEPNDGEGGNAAPAGEPPAPEKNAPPADGPPAADSTDSDD